MGQESAEQPPAAFTGAQPANAGLRERKKSATRQTIFDVSMALFAKNGYEATTIDEIILAASVSRRTFFRYFETKLAIVTNDTRRVAGRVEAVFRSRPNAESVLESLRYALLESTRSREWGDLERFNELLELNPLVRAGVISELDVSSAGLCEAIAARVGMGHADTAVRVVGFGALAALLNAFDGWGARGRANSTFDEQLVVAIQTLAAGLDSFPG